MNTLQVSFNALNDAFYNTNGAIISSLQTKADAITVYGTIGVMSNLFEVKTSSNLDLINDSKVFISSNLGLINDSKVDRKSVV